MEDENIKELFQRFQPDMSSDSLFLNRLKRNMEAVEIVKQHSSAVRRRNRIAVTVAALCGVVTGLIMGLLLQIISQSEFTIDLALPASNFIGFRFNWQIIGWMIAAIACALTANNVYELMMAKTVAKNQ